jgi:hypothetical protein
MVVKTQRLALSNLHQLARQEATHHFRKGDDERWLFESSLSLGDVDPAVA